MPEAFPSDFTKRLAPMKSLQSEIGHHHDLATDAPARFRRIAQAHPLWRHPFVERCRAGDLTLQ